MISASTTGRLGQDATSTATASGMNLVKFSIAVKQTKDATEWVNCVIWGDRSMKLLPHLKKGTQVWVAGDLSVNRYKAKDGEDKSSLEINVQTFEFVGSKPDSPKTSHDDSDLDGIPF